MKHNRNQKSMYHCEILFSLAFKVLFFAVYSISLCAAAESKEQNKNPLSSANSSANMGKGLPQYIPWKGEAFSGKVWAATAPDQNAPIENCSLRVVDFGDDYAWFEIDQFLFSEWLGIYNKNSFFFEKGLDLDNDGKKNDSVTFVPFDLEHPLGACCPSRWDPEGINAFFYCSRTMYAKNYDKGPAFICESGGPNVDHSLGCDDLNMMAWNPIGSFYEFSGYGLWLWKKEDFLGGGHKNVVTFDNNSRLGLNFPRFFLGTEGGRFVVLDVDPANVSSLGQFWISEYKILPPPGQKSDVPFAASVFANQTKWAKYNPHAPYYIEFDDKSAKFENHVFKDIRAAGYYIERQRFSTDNITVKIGAFEVDAVVRRPSRPSELLKMSAVPDSTVNAGGAKVDVPSFYISACEIPYPAWVKVYRWSVSSSYVYKDRPGYVYECSGGELGSMGTGDQAHKPDEPVTAMTWLDALLWCNALSETEGRTPCYYTDPEYKKVFRMATLRTPMPGYETEYGKYNPKVFVKWDADGYRLPTAAEWLASWKAGGNKILNKKALTTHPVGTTVPNKLGMYDLDDNVWEWIWDADGGTFDASSDTIHTVMGGDFYGLADPRTTSATCWGGMPFNGAHNIGFRVVRCVGGKTKPVPDFVKIPKLPVADISGKTYGVPLWTFTKGERIRGGLDNQSMKKIEMAEIPSGIFAKKTDKGVLDFFITSFFCQKTEVPYFLWNYVRQWALSKDYEFNCSGDMGSMYYQSAVHEHSPNEPVTRITFDDIMIWCNALSEMEGRIPAFYADEGLTKVLRKAHKNRFFVMHQKYEEIDWNKVSDIDARKFFRMQFPQSYKFSGPFYTKWDADGYRIPTSTEFEYAARAGAEPKSFWEDRFNPLYAWCRENSNLTTHPVGLLQANKWGLYDVTGNVMEYVFDGNIMDTKYSGSRTRNPKSASSYPFGLGAITIDEGSFFTFKLDSNVTGVPRGASIYPNHGFRVMRPAPVPWIEIDGTRYEIIGSLRDAFISKKGKKISYKGEIKGEFLELSEIKEEK